MPSPVGLEGPKDERERAGLKRDLDWEGVDAGERLCFSNGVSLGEKATASVPIPSSSCADIIKKLTVYMTYHLDTARNISSS